MPRPESQRKNSDRRELLIFGRAYLRGQDDKLSPDRLALVHQRSSLVMLWWWGLRCLLAERRGRRRMSRLSCEAIVFLRASCYGRSTPSRAWVNLATIHGRTIRGSTRAIQACGLPWL